MAGSDNSYLNDDGYLCSDNIKGTTIIVICRHNGSPSGHDSPDIHHQHFQLLPVPDNISDISENPGFSYEGAGHAQAEADLKIHHNFPAILQ